MSESTRPLFVEVALLPSLVTTIESKLVVVVDVLRAATSLAVMASSGVPEVIVAPDPDAARQIAREIGNARLCGESDGLKPADFDRGNSPGDYRDPTIGERPIVFCSSNGARALHQLAAAPLLLFGALVNARSVAKVLVDHADRGHERICLVCSGNGHGSQVSLEDTFCAGLIVDHLRDSRGGEVILDDAAQTALRLYRSYLPSESSQHGNPAAEAARAMFAESSAARKLRSWGLDKDVQECARVDQINEVMRVAPRGELLVATPVPRLFPVTTTPKDPPAALPTGGV